MTILIQTAQPLLYQFWTMSSLTKWFLAHKKWSKKSDGPYLLFSFNQIRLMTLGKGLL